MNKLKYKYVVIEGNIGAGKTSLAKKLSHDFNGELVLEEFAENTFLPLFYENPSKYAFPLELSFLAARFQQLRNLGVDDNERTIISDYHFRKTLVFAEANLDPAELQLFSSFFDIVSNQIPEPELVIFLKKDLKQLKANISKRGRDFENEITTEYLTKISDGYTKMLSEYPLSKVVIIETNGLDFMAKEDDYQSIIDLINKA